MSECLTPAERERLEKQRDVVVMVLQRAIDLATTGNFNMSKFDKEHAREIYELFDGAMSDGFYHLLQRAMRTVLWQCQDYAPLSRDALVEFEEWFFNWDYTLMN